MIPTRLLIIILMLIMTALTAAEPAAAQEVITATPVLINLSTLVPPTAAPVLQPTPTWTATQGLAYPVIGRYFQWYQFQFPSAPNGRGWVFGALVEIIGDASGIPEIDPISQPTLPPAIFGATLTAEIITRTPGGILTATAEALMPVATAVGQIDAPGQILPTFTYPPGIIPIAPTQAPTRSILDSSTATPPALPTSSIRTDLPPVAPIAILAVLGLLGLVISSIRR